MTLFDIKFILDSLIKSSKYGVMNFVLPKMERVVHNSNHDYGLTVYKEGG